MYSKALILTITWLTVTHVEISRGANVLFAIGISSHSHRVAIQPLISKMADRGHNVTVFSPIKPEVPHPKVTEFCTQALKDANEKMAEDTTSAAAIGRLKDRYYDPFFEGNTCWDIMLGIAEATLKTPEFQEWIKSSHFDLIIYDYSGKEFLHAIAHKMKAKIIAFMSYSTTTPSDFDNLGLPLDSWLEGMEANKYWYIPNRYYNTLNPLAWYFSYTRYYLPKMEALTREVFDFEFPPLEKLVKENDLIFLNEHVSANYAKAYPPSVIPVGGMHVKDSNGTLPKEMEDFIADADNFVYISFGSIIRVSKLPKETQQVLFDAVASFPNTRFFWKWEGEIPNNMPKNAFAKNWFPQQDVLANPKCKGFVTQGGVMSFQQAIHHAVPIVVVPGFGDQPFVARSAVHLGIGIYLELSDITKETFSEAIRQILQNTKYSRKMSEVSSKFNDRPLSAVDTAVWWSEYVLRHDTSHLRSAALQQNWWERRSLDLWFLIFAVTFVVAICSSVGLFAGIRFIRKKLLENSSTGRMNKVLKECID